MPIIKTIPPGQTKEVKLDVEQYADCGALARGLADLVPYDASPYDLAFYGAPYADALQMAHTGAPDLVAEADRIMGQIENTIEMETMGKRTVAAVAGGAVCVPAMLAGHPAAMRQRRASRNASNPIAVIVNAGAQADVSSATIQRRGAAVLALTRIVSKVRPVELWMMCGHSDNRKHALTLVQIETRPLDITRAAFCMSHPAFLRRLMFTRSHAATGTDCFPPLFNNTLGAHATAARILGFDDYIASHRLSDDSDFPDDARAADWVRKHVQAHCEG